MTLLITGEASGTNSPGTGICPCADEALSQAEDQLARGEIDTFWIEYAHECEGEAIGYISYVIQKDTLTGAVTILKKSWVYTSFI